MQTKAEQAWLVTPEKHFFVIFLVLETEPLNWLTWRQELFRQVKNGVPPCHAQWALHIDIETKYETVWFESKHWPNGWGRSCLGWAPAAGLKKGEAVAHCGRCLS